MQTKRAREGYLLIDHRASPGLTAADLARVGLVGPGFPGGTAFEAATYCCGHCQRLVVRNPARTRERAWCSKCDVYICDLCAGRECRPVQQAIDTILKRKEYSHG